MRIAIISDIHGNGTALDAVLQDIQPQKVDRILCLGDIATLGPQPRHVLDTLQNLKITCIAGNHDAALLDLKRAIEFHIAPTLLPTLEWCAQQLTQTDLDYLKSFPATLEITLENGATLLCYHGSPRAHTDNLLATTPAAELEILCAPYHAAVFAGGHTHIQMLRQQRGKLFINPGSVGSPFSEPAVPDQTPTILPWAEYAILTTHENNLAIELRRVSFDTQKFIRQLEQSDLPIRAWWIQQYK